MVEDVVVGFEDAVRGQLSRMNCQMLSTGLSSGDFGGNGKSVMLSGMESLFETCHPA
jgi:hypothetical protein